jgi:hypothetical protein
MTISIDGASQEIYSLYRVNGNFNTVIENIKKLNYYKQKYNSKFPELLWQYVLMEHNENDVVKAKMMAKELNMRIWFKLTWEAGYVPKNVKMLKKETGLNFLTEEEAFTNLKSPIYTFCDQLWTAPQINWDGRLLGCCIVCKYDFGVNVFKVGLKKAINSENYRYAKKMIQGKVGIPEKIENLPCAHCAIFNTMNKKGVYFN